MIKLPHYYNHPGFIEAIVDRVQTAIATLDSPGEGEPTRLVFTAHSIPVVMAEAGPYERQLQEAARLISERLEYSGWDLVYQSRSGPPQQPWLEPDICDHVQACHQRGIDKMVVVPLGFVSDHMEVIYDLDHEAHDLCEQLGMKMARAGTVGIHPRFVSGLSDMIADTISGRTPEVLGDQGVWPMPCPTDCCVFARPTRPRS